eukprot:scaffold217_cov341-Pavlova_lutheri.AAC.10
MLVLSEEVLLFVSLIVVADCVETAFGLGSLVWVRACFRRLSSPHPHSLVVSSTGARVAGSRPSPSVDRETTAKTVVFARSMGAGRVGGAQGSCPQGTRMERSRGGVHHRCRAAMHVV